MPDRHTWHEDEKRILWNVIQSGHGMDVAERCLKDRTRASICSYMGRMGWEFRGHIPSIDHDFAKMMGVEI